MEVYELDLKVYILKEIHHKKVFEKCAAIIDKALVFDDKMAEFHQKIGYKYFTFSSLYPIEKLGVYKEGVIYTLVIRTVNKELALYLKEVLPNVYTKELKALTLSMKKIVRKHYEKLYSLTPIIQKYPGGYWKNTVSLQAFEERLKINLIKKYNLCTNSKLDENFDLFTMIRFDNHKPIGCHYKNVTLLGDKITVMIADNASAQNLAYMALGCGLGEMNARGYGFCNYKYV